MEDRTRVPAHKRRPGWRTALGALVGTVLLVLGGSLSLFLLTANSSGASAPFIHAQPGSIPWDGVHRLNLLLLQVDGAGSADAIALVSYDPRSQSESILSIPPNLWVTIPGYGPDRIAHAYSDGGTSLMLTVVQAETRVPIPYYAVVDRSAFARIVNAFGGVTVRVPAGMADESTSTGVHLVRGVQQLDGQSALDFTRLPRPDAGGDLGPMRRQQETLRAFQGEVMQPSNLFKIATVVNSLGGTVSTNFPYNEIPDLARRLMSLPSTHIHAAIPAVGNGTVTSYNTGSSVVLLPDPQRMVSMSQRLFSDAPLASSRVSVLNGSGVADQASNLAGWLHGAGFDIVHVGSASSFHYAHTQVVLGKGASPNALHVARSLSTLLRAPTVTRRVHQGGSPIEVIIGQDYQDTTHQ